MQKIKRLIRIRYPKISLLIIAIILSYIIFSNEKVSAFVSSLGDLSYLGVFAAGMLFTLGFTSPFSAGFFIVLNPPNIWLAGVIGGFGALLTDLLIFRFIRFSFMDEFVRLEKTRLFKKTINLIDGKISKKIKTYLLYTIAGIFIASPLPDEAGIMMLAGLTKIKQNIFAIVSFLLNTIGITILLLI